MSNIVNSAGSFTVNILFVTVGRYLGICNPSYEYRIKAGKLNIGLCGNGEVGYRYISGVIVFYGIVCSRLYTIYTIGIRCNDLA
jgi:hypothetical protein